MSSLTYWNAVESARSLLSEQIRDPEGESNPEYERGICELLSDCFNRGGPHSVAQDIGLTAQGSRSDEPLRAADESERVDA